MSKHTPGPWQVIGGNVYGDNLRALLPMNGADARLIAAAPDLLEALHHVMLCEVNSMSSRQEMVRIARAAIEKAEKK